jgi:hypothetical protein
MFNSLNKKPELHKEFRKGSSMKVSSYFQAVSLLIGSHFEYGMEIAKYYGQ